MNTIESGWDDFKDYFITNETPDFAIKLLKVAFYSGASTVLRVDYEASKLNLDSAKFAMMDTLHQERIDFFGQINPGTTINDIGL